MLSQEDTSRSSSIAMLATLWESAQRRRSTLFRCARLVARLVSALCWSVVACAALCLALEGSQALSPRGLSYSVVVEGRGDSARRPLVGNCTSLPSAPSLHSQAPQEGQSRRSAFALWRWDHAPSRSLELCGEDPQGAGPQARNRGAFWVRARRTATRRTLRADLLNRGLLSALPYRSGLPQRIQRALPRRTRSAVGGALRHRPKAHQKGARAPPRNSFLTTCPLTPLFRPLPYRGPDFQANEGV